MTPKSFSIRRAIVISAACALCTAALALPQGSHFDYEENEANVTVSQQLLHKLEFRSLEFSRGGRSTAVAGVPGQPQVYYMGASGGGVWKTSDAGDVWENVSDGFFGVGSIGAIAVADSDPNVVYVGTGSACPRGNITTGDGIYKSSDAGKTWRHIGLRQAGQIGRIRVHPDNPDLVYAAVLGHIFGPSEERGIYRSEDGGATWERVHFISDRTGFVDLSMDMTNPRVLYAAAWSAERKPWAMLSGSEDGGLFKTTDGGDTWTRLEGGLPTGMVGRIAVAVSPANPNRVWALLEAEGERGGVYRSEDAGASWLRINGDANLRQRPWYYIHIFADPKDENTVYALNTGFYKSVDGGKSFDTRIDVPHGDNHDLWLNPDDPAVMINSNDGGANVSFNGGRTWSGQMNQPTSEIYRLVVDDQWPYRVYGPQQDNSTISIPSRRARGRAVWPDWYAVGGGESGHIAVDPRDPNIVYAGSYGGRITRLDRTTGELRQILGYPQLQLGSAARDLHYRFQWNAPINISPHDPDVLYHSSQVIHKSEDEGQSWKVISPDLTTNNTETQDFAGGPITHDATGVEVYNTIFAFVESPHQRGELWAGSDDGKVHISRDGGGNWKDITPEGLPAGGTVNVVEISPHASGRAFIAVYRYRENDFHPYIYRTDNHGDRWDLLTDGTNGIPETHFTRAIREDPERKGLLYVGTEFGLYVSFDDGAHWQSFQNNLPVTPVTDLRVHRNDLVISTQGRSFWVLDDVTPLHQFTDEVQKADLWLFEPRIAYRSGNLGNARINYYIGKMPDGELTLDFLDANGDVLRSFSGQPGAEREDLVPQRRSVPEPTRISVQEGMNLFEWSLRREALSKPDGVVHWSGNTPGRLVVPASFRVRLSTGEWSQTRTLTVALSPSSSATVAELEQQDRLLVDIAAEIDALFGGLTTVREIKSQANSVLARMDTAGLDVDPVAEAGKALTAKLTEIEEEITQVKSKSGQDPINFPPRIDNQLTNLYGFVASGDFRPTAGAHKRLEDLKPDLADIMTRLHQVIRDELAAFNEQVRKQNLPAVIVAPPSRATTTEQEANW